MDDELSVAEEELDKLTTEILLPLRASKTLSQQKMGELIGLLDRFVDLLKPREDVPRLLVGKLLLIFSSMLAEADHARDPALILDAAWAVQERLRRMFAKLR